MGYCYLTSDTSDISIGGVDCRVASPSYINGSTNFTVPTQNGTGLNLQLQYSGTPVVWFTPKLSSVTITSVTSIYLYGNEANAFANCAWRIKCERCDSAGNVISTIWDTTNSSEINSMDGAQLITPSVTSTTLSDGDRLKFTVYAASFGTMASGYTVTLKTNSGSSNINFTQAVGNVVDGTTYAQLWPRTTASDINPGSDTELEASLTAGTSPASSSCTTVGSGSNIQLQYGGTNVCWFSPPLYGHKLLSGSYLSVNGWASESSMSANAAIGLKVERTDSSGTPIETIWDITGNVELTTSLAAITLSGNSAGTVTLADGDRLKFTFQADPAPGYTMGNGYTVTSRFNGDTVAADGGLQIMYPAFFCPYSAPSSSISKLSSVAASNVKKVDALAFSSAKKVVGVANT